MCDASPPTEPGPPGPAHTAVHPHDPPGELSPVHHSTLSLLTPHLPLLTLPPLTLPQESNTSYSKEVEQLWLGRRYDQLREVSAVLTPAHERMLKAIDTHNMADFL